MLFLREMGDKGNTGYKISLKFVVNFSNEKNKIIKPIKSKELSRLKFNIMALFFTLLPPNTNIHDFPYAIVLLAEDKI